MDLKTRNKAIRTEYLQDINIRLFSAQRKNNGRIPHKKVYQIVIDSKATFPWITCNIINKQFRKFIKEQQNNLQETTNFINNIQENNRNEVTISLIQLSAPSQPN